VPLESRAAVGGPGDRWVDGPRSGGYELGDEVVRGVDLPLEPLQPQRVVGARGPPGLSLPIARDCATNPGGGGLRRPGEFATNPPV